MARIHNLSWLTVKLGGFLFVQNKTHVKWYIINIISSLDSHKSIPGVQLIKGEVVIIEVLIFPQCASN